MKLKDTLIIEGSPSKMAEQLEIAKQRLGKNWVLHPEYKPTKAHMCRESFILADIRHRAIKAGRL